MPPDEARAGAAMSASVSAMRCWTGAISVITHTIMVVPFAKNKKKKTKIVGPVL
jgi:hypothetical protein